MFWIFIPCFDIFIPGSEIKWERKTVYQICMMDISQHLHLCRKLFCCLHVHLLNCQFLTNEVDKRKYVSDSNHLCNLNRFIVWDSFLWVSDIWKGSFFIGNRDFKWEANSYLPGHGFRHRKLNQNLPVRSSLQDWNCLWQQKALHMRIQLTDPQWNLTYSMSYSMPYCHSEMHSLLNMTLSQNKSL